MRNKLKLLSVALLLGSAFSMAACDTVNFALPEKVQSEQVLNLGDEKIPHNEVQELFETLVPNDSSTASKVLDKLVQKLAESYFGSFYDVKDEGGEYITKGLRTIVKSDEDIKAFVNTHARFQIKDAAGARQEAKEIQGVKDFAAFILKAIQKHFWTMVNNSTYQDRYFFSEKKFYDAQKAAMYDLRNPVNQAYGAALDNSDHLTQLIGGRDHKSVGLYFGSDEVSYLDVYEDYVQRNVLPDIYRKAVVENYLKRNNYNALGRSHARKVQTISLKNLDESADATRNLITHYANFILEGAILDDEAKPANITEDEVKECRDLHFLSKLYSGLIDVNTNSLEAQVAKFLYEKANWAMDYITIDGEDIAYYPLTTLGKIYKDYKEISDTRWESSSDTDFTGSGAYTKQTGLMLKTRETVSKTLVAEGWYTSSGLSDLPSDLRSRLFKIQVANDVDSTDATEKKTLDYGMYVEGSYYLTPETYGTTAHPYLIYDSGSSSWVIVRVDEAVKGPKLSQDPASVTSYDYMASKGMREGKETQNEIVITIANLMADSDTYTKAARQEILEEAKIQYHDQSVYDYFETNFPDLFK